MNPPINPTSAPPRTRRLRPWPWALLALTALTAVWNAVAFPDDPDDEFPAVARTTFSPHPPFAYRLAEPGDEIDRLSVCLASLAVVLAVRGLCAGGGKGSAPGGRRPWLAAAGVSLAAFWYAANPGPTFDGWHGLGWGTIFDPSAPAPQRVALALAAAALAALVARGAGRGGWADLWREGRARGVASLFAAAAVLAAVRVSGLPGVEPAGYWPRWALAGALVAFCSALGRALSSGTGRGGWVPRVAGLAAWAGLLAAGLGLHWYHRPIERLRAVVPGRIYMSAMPTARGLEVAHRRHRFKTVINLFPEDTPYRSPRLPEELRFVREHGLRYYGCPADVASSNAFLDTTLRVAQSPDAWPILVHCHACMDRTPAWVGLYQFVARGRPLDEIFRFIEGHRGFLPKVSVSMLYQRVLPRLAPDRYRADPTAALIRRALEGTPDPFEPRLRAEQAQAARRPDPPPRR